MPSTTSQDQNVIAVVAYGSTKIFSIESGIPGTQVEAPDDKGHSANLAHKAGNPGGVYENDVPAYWKLLADHLAGAAAIVLLGHGKGRANASHAFVSWVEKNDRPLAEVIVADVRCDIDHLTDEQFVAIGRYYFDGPAARDSRLED
jgi:hypothetical protein